MIPFLLVFTNLILNAINIRNKVVILSVFFLLVHLFTSELLNYQLNTVRKSTRILSNKEIAKFSGFIIALIGIITYLILSFLPGVKILVYPLKFLPYSNYYLDLLLIILPMIAVGVIVRKLNTDKILLSEEIAEES